MRLLVEGLPDDPRRDLHRDRADLRAELLEHAVALGADLLLRTGDDALGFLLGLGLEVAAQLIRGRARFLDDAVRLLPGAGELRPVFLLELVGLLAGGLGALHLPLDLLPALLEHLLEARDHPLPGEEEQDAEGDQPDDQLAHGRVQVLRLGDLLCVFLGLREDRRDQCMHQSSPSSDDERERDAEERERLDQADADEHRGADLIRVLGLAGHRLDRLADQDAEPDARARSPRAR